MLEIDHFKYKSYILTRGKTRVNVIRFFEMKPNICRVLINCENISFAGNRVTSRVMLKNVEFSDLQRIEITFHSSELHKIENAICAMLNSNESRKSVIYREIGLVYFSESTDYAWTKLAIKVGKPLSPRTLIQAS